MLLHKRIMFDTTAMLSLSCCIEVLKNPGDQMPYRPAEDNGGSCRMQTCA